jgi:hypothetical protein
LILSSYAELRKHFAQAALTVTNAVNNGAGAVRLTVSPNTSLLTTLKYVSVQNIPSWSTYEANGVWQISVVDGTHIDLNGSTFVNAWSSPAGATPFLFILANDGFPVWPGPVLANGSIDGSVGQSTSGSMLRKYLFGWNQLGTVRTSGAQADYFQMTSQGGTTMTSASAIGPLLDPTKLAGGDVGFPFTISLNNAVADPTPGQHQFKWYLSQRRDPGSVADPTGTTTTPWGPNVLTTAANTPPFFMVHPNVVNSSIVTLGLNLPAIAQLVPGVTGTGLMNPDVLAVLFRNVGIYCLRVAGVGTLGDGSIQYASLYLPPGAPAGTD